MPDPTPYTVGGIAVSAGSALTVQIPPRVFLGRLTGLLFDTNKTFLLARSLKGIKGLKRFFDAHPGAQVLVVGHTDTVGAEQSNLTLSMERARSIAAYLKDDVDTWMEFYPGRTGSAHWGTVEDQHMLSELADSTGAKFYTGAIDGSPASSREAVRRFQQSKGLNADGEAGQRTRKALVTAYMQIEGTTLPQGTVLQTHGCGKFHLAVPTPDQTPEQRNRRAEVFFFESRIDPPPRPRCPAPGCPEQPQWLRRTVQTFDLEHAPGALEVTVRDPQGQVVASASVHASGPTAADGQTDAAGSVLFSDLIPGSYTVLGQKQGFRDGTVSAQVSESASPALAPASTAVQLQAAPGDLVVTVRDPSGGGIAGALVLVQDSTGASVGSAPTAQGGTVTFPALAAGSFSVGASAPGFSGQTVTAQVLPNQTNTAQVTLARATGNLTVHVVDNLGGALVNASVSVAPASGTAPASQSTNAQGNVIFNGLEVGAAQITAALQGFNAGSGSATVVAQGSVTANITLTANTATLDVHVTNSVGGGDLTGAQVALVGPSGSFSATTAGGGLARFNALPPGSYTATVTLKDFAQGTGTSQARINQTNLLNVALTSSVGSLQVLVQDNLGAAVTGASVTLTPAALTAPASAVTDAQGRIGFTRVPVGSVSILVRKTGFRDGTGTASVLANGSASATIILQPAAVALTVRVVSSAGGSNLAGAAVSVTGPTTVQGPTDANGSITFNLPVATYQVSASLDNFTAPAAQSITLGTSQTNALTITLTPKPVTASASALPLVVVLKKHNCSPARTPVRLGIAGTFTGTGTGRFTRSLNTVKFFNLAINGIEVAFNGTDNVFTAAQLTAGVTLFAEGGAVSTSQQDTDLRLELFVGTNAFGTPAAGKATCLDLTVDLFQSRASRSDPAAMAANAKTDRGRFVHLQDPNFQHGRAWLVVREVRPPNFAQDLELKTAPAAGGAATGAVQLFPAEIHAAGEAAVALPHAITQAQLSAAPQVAGSRGLAFFVEGQTVSNAVRDVQLQLGIRGGEADGDRAAFTAVRFTNFQVTIPSNQALTDRTANGFTNTPVQNTVVRRATAAAIAAADFDESYAANVPIVMIENSLAAANPVQLQVTVQPANPPVLWSRLRDTRPAGAAEGGGDANDVINPVPAPANARPAVTALAGTPTLARANLLPDSVGSFRVRAFVDENGSGDFDRDPATADSFAPEPYILMNFVLVRAVGVNNLSRANNGPNLTLRSAAGGPPTGNANVVSVTGNMTAGANAGVWARAVVNVIGGGSNGRRGLDRVFSNWIQEIIPTPGSTAPGGNTLDWGADYQLTVPHPVGPPTVQIHHQFLVAAQEPRGTFLPPPAAQPTRMPMPMLDASPFASAGMGGVLTAGMGAPGPNAINKVAIPAVGGATPSGQQWTVEMWDPPGIPGYPAAHPGFAGAQMIAYRFNVDFHHDLCFWTNNQAAAGALGQPTVGKVVTPISGPGVGPPDAACCLFASVYTNTWNVRLSLTFAATAPFAATVVTPFATSMTLDPAASRVARPIANLEVRFPPAVNRLSFDATT